MTPNADRTADLDPRLLACLQSVFPFLPEDELREVRRDQLDEWDSLAALSLVTLLEEEFGIVLDDDAVDRLTTFTEIREVLLARADVTAG